MTDRESPPLDKRRTEEFRLELTERANAWIPGWNTDGTAGGFGDALLEVAARFNAQVAERLDRAGEKMSLGLLDWLAVRGQAARPARLPVAFKLNDNATESVLAPRPVQLQVNAGNANLVFETEADVRLVPGSLDAVVAIDAAIDTYYLPPPGISVLDPIEPLPAQWRTTAFAAAQSEYLQLDPAIGLAADMLLEIDGLQYRVVSAESNLVRIEPPLTPAGGIPQGSVVRKVASFIPYGNGARNKQLHALYLGDSDLFSIDSRALIEIHGAKSKLSNAKWEYYGKANGDETPAWRELKKAADDKQASDKLALDKPPGAIEPTKINNLQARWIRATQIKVDGPADILNTESVKVALNPGDSDQACPANGAAKPGAETEAEGFANSSPLMFSTAFYPLGREPRLFDTFYLGSDDAFSKRNAGVSICFEMSNLSANIFAVLREGRLANKIIASIGGDSALHLIAADPQTGALSHFFNRPPLQPPNPNGTSVPLDKAPPYRPPMWAVNDDNSISNPSDEADAIGPFYVAASAGTSVWVRKEYPSAPSESKWLSFGNVPAPTDATKIDSLLYLRTGDDAAGAQLYALCGGKIYTHGAHTNYRETQWLEHPPLSQGPDAGNNDEPFILRAIVPIEKMDAAVGRWHGAPGDGIVGVFENNVKSLLYFISSNGVCTEVYNSSPIMPCSHPAATKIGDDIVVFWQVDNLPQEAIILRACRRSVSVPAVITSEPWDLSSDGPAALAGTQVEHRRNPGKFPQSFLEIPPSADTASVLATSVKGGANWLLSWTPFLAQPEQVQDPVGAGVGPLGGAPSAFGNYIAVPGTQSDAWTSQLDALLSRSFNAEIESGFVVAASFPAIQENNYIGYESASGFEYSEVGDIELTLGAERFHSLTTQFGVGSADKVFLLYRYGSTGAGQLQGDKIDADTFQVHSRTNLPARDDWILVRDGAATRSFRKVTDVTPAPDSDPVITLDPATGQAFSGNTVHYWLPVPVSSARAAPFCQLDNVPSIDWDASVLDRTRLKVSGHTPVSLAAKAFKKNTASGNPELIVFSHPWDTGSDGNANISFIASLRGWARQLNENSTDPTLAWEYWNGHAWDQLTTEADGTDDLKRTGSLKFKVPASLAPTEVNGKPNHWIRARLVAGDYGSEIVSVVTQPHPDPSKPNTTIQQVIRDASKFRPPLVLNMRIRYSIEASVPAYLLTQDGGSTRNQSDANHSMGTYVEALVPLGVQLGRLEHAGIATSPPTCPPDCTCSNASAASGAEVSGQDAPLTPVARAIFLGFSASLAEEPVNVLLLLDERNHASFAPLRVDALVNDRFEPVAVSDRTRALGESGILSMSFPVKPTPRDLFGRTLTWLRLSPSAAVTGEEWAPVIRGAYLNAVYAKATETLTREALGSSDGRPHLSVQLARPPLLAGTLELRVREPLGDEERKALVEQDYDSVKSQESDLPGDWVLWRQVPDPDDYGARERVYALDETSGEIVFGDGVHGKIPPIGRDAVVAFRYQRSEPPPDGGDTVPANEVAARTAMQLVTPIEGVESAFAAEHAAGGASPEQADRILRFGGALLRHRDRALSLQDFEDIALSSSPGIAQALALRTEGGLRLVIVMRGPEPHPRAAQCRELKRLLQGKASPLFGAPVAIDITGPKVRRLRIALTLRVTSLDQAGALGNAVRQALATLFSTAVPAQRGWPLGAPPVDEDLALAVLNAGSTGLEGIQDIELSEIDEAGNQVPWRPVLRRDELILLADDPFRIRFEPLEVAI